MENPTIVRNFQRAESVPVVIKLSQQQRISGLALFPEGRRENRVLAMDNSVIDGDLSAATTYQLFVTFEVDRVRGVANT